MYWYHQRGALAHNSNSVGTGNNHTLHPRLPNRSPTNQPFIPRIGSGSSLGNSISFPLVPRIPYRPPGMMHYRQNHGSYRASTTHPYSRAQVRQNLPGPPPGPSREGSARRSIPAPTTRNSRCEICSFSQKPPDAKKPVHHDHYSSKSLREILGVEFALSGAYFCPSCKGRHAPYPTERTKIVLSDSTLHNFFAPPNHTSTQYEGDIQHSDYVTIPGATLETIFHAYKLEYSHHTKPVDLFVVAGYNDLVRNYGRDHIVHTIKNFVEYVRGLDNEDNSSNTVTIGTLLYPPQLAWFRDDGPEPENYTNQKSKIDWINREIASINIENGMEHFVGVHKYGTRVANLKSVDEHGQVQVRHVKKHRWEQWRERDRCNMLHLSNERRFVLGRAINEYFINRT